MLVASKDEVFEMHDLDRNLDGKSCSSNFEQLIASVADDFRELKQILGRFSLERLELDRRQLDCILRANEAAERGIELSSRLSSSD